MQFNSDVVTYNENHIQSSNAHKLDFLPENRRPMAFATCMILITIPEAQNKIRLNDPFLGSKVSMKMYTGTIKIQGWNQSKNWIVCENSQTIANVLKTFGIEPSSIIQNKMLGEDCNFRLADLVTKHELVAAE